MNFKGVDLNLLVAFDALMAERNVSRAAARVGVSQPAMSAALSRFRNIVGDHLFTRTASGLQPTQRARDLAEPISQALGKIESVLITKPKFVPLDATFTFSLGVSDYPAFTFLPKFVKAMEQLAPNINLKAVSFTARDNAVEMLDNGVIDAAIGVPPTHTEGRIQSKEILLEKFVTIVSSDNPAARNNMTLERFLSLSHILVSPEGDEFGVVDQELARTEKSRKVVMTLPHMFAAASVVSETSYISTILRGAALSSPYQDKLVLFPPPISLKDVGFNLLWHKRNDDHAAQKWLRDLITKIASSTKIETSL